MVNGTGQNYRAGIETPLSKIGVAGFKRTQTLLSFLKPCLKNDIKFTLYLVYFMCFKCKPYTFSHCFKFHNKVLERSN